MPIRYVSVPKATVLKDPVSGAPLRDGDLEQTFSFGDFLQKLMHNPMWSENYANMRAQDAIMTAWEKTQEEEAKLSPMILELAEEDWVRLKAAAEHPRYETLHPTIGRQIMPGYGFHPSMARQLLPFVAAVMEAETHRRPQKIIGRPETRLED